MNFKKENIEELLKSALETCTRSKNKVVGYVKETRNQLNAKVEAIDIKSTSFKNVNFNFHHLVSVVIVSVFAFLVTFYSTSYNTKEVAAAGFSAPETVVFNEKALDVSYGDTKAIANVAKEILKDEVSSVNELKTLSSSIGKGVYALDDYVIEVTLDQVTLGESIATMTIENKATYEKNDSEKVIVNADSNVPLNTGNSYTYQIALNIIDTEAPVITLKESEVTIKDTDDFDVKNYIESVVDNVDGSVDYTVEGEIARDDDKYVAGDYNLIIRANDSSSNGSVAELKVIVEKTEEEKVEELTTQQSYGSYGVSAYAGSVVAEARAQIGKAYVYGANGPNAFDCSGLVQYVYARSGISIPRTSGGQSSVGVAIDPNDVSQWRAGDIVTFGPGGSSHAAIYSGNGTLIHALNPSQGIRETGIYGFGTVYAVRRVQ